MGTARYVFNIVYIIFAIFFTIIFIDVVFINYYSRFMQMKKTRKDRVTQKALQSEETKARLVAAARELFTEHGYHEVSVTEIAETAGVTHGMINAHFHAKAGLLYAVIHENNDQQIQIVNAASEFSGDLLEWTRQFVRVFIDYELETPELLSVMQSYYWQWPDHLEEQNVRQLRDAFKPFRARLVKAIAEGEIVADTDFGRLERMIYAIYAMGLRPAVYAGATAQDCEDEIMAQIEILFRGLRP